MRDRPLSLLVAALLLAPSLAHAGGFDIAWGPSCWQDNPVSAKTFACNTNTGNDRFTISFVPDAPMADFGESLVTFDIQAGSPTLPDWWNAFTTGSCRPTGMTETTSFGLVTTSCEDPWQDSAGSGISSYKTQASDATVPANAARVTAVAAITIPNAIDPGLEVMDFTIIVSHVKTVGSGSCAGCSTPAAIALNTLQYGPYLGPDHTLSSAVHNGCITWQASGPCGAVPARNHTWGLIQSLYR